MVELIWGGIGQRYFETGIDRGVLYPRVGPGVAWNGIKSVSEKPTGGSPTPFYYDGFKYLNLASAEEFEATIEAYSAPDEFAKCDGTQSVLNGLFITQQRREQFGLSYRTKIGNDVDGQDHGYKIHIIYNALASTTSRNYRSVSRSTEPAALSWTISTVAPAITGFRPSAHFVIDSRYTPSILLSQFEGMLYGTASNDPYLPAVTELMSMFNAMVFIQMFKEQEDGTLALENVPAIRSVTAPVPAVGQEILWLDISAGYGKLTLVTGE
jgi:hypothetical protein